MANAGRGANRVTACTGCGAILRRAWVDARNRPWCGDCWDTTAHEIPPCSLCGQQAAQVTLVRADAGHQWWCPACRERFATGPPWRAAPPEPRK